MPNFLRELNLPLDPSPTESMIKEALQKRRSTINTQANQGRISQEIKKKKLAELSKVEAVMNDPVERPKAIAAELKEILDMLRKAAVSMQQAGIDVYTKADMEAKAKELNVQTATVEKVFKENGLHESNGTPTVGIVVQIPKRYPQEKPIEDHIVTLWSHAEETKGTVVDLYSFMAYYSGLTPSPMSKDELIHMDRESLGLQVERWAQDCAMNRTRNALTTALNNLLADCQMMLKSDETQKQYQVSILFQTCKTLTEIETTLGSARENPQFADSKIMEIAVHFHVDESVALAIYNQKIAPQNYTPSAPYRPTIQCPECRLLVAVKDQNGHKATKCPNCKNDLYFKCRCGKIVPAVTERCDCGRRIFDQRYIPDYAKSAKLHISQNHFGQARQLVNQIILLDDKAEVLTELNKALESFTKKQTALHSDLEELCNAKRYYEARARMQREPELSIGFRRTSEIEDRIARADALKLQYGASPTEVQANQILNTCVDIPGVIMPPPRPARNIRANYNMEANVVELFWEASESASFSKIVYDVHRQINGKKPEMVGAGLIASGLSVTNFVDNDAPSGKNVWYYVVAKRNDKSSQICVIPDSKKIMQEIQESSLNISSSDRHISFVWSIPRGAQGIRIMRNDRDLKIPMGRTSAEVDGIPGQYDKFVFQAVYEFDGVKYYTHGITKNAAPTLLRPIPFSLEELHNGHLRATWSRQSENAKIVFILTSQQYASGDSVDESTIQSNAVNRTVHSAQVINCSCDLGIAPIGSFQVAGFINIGSAFIACPPVAYSNTPSISTKGVTYDNVLSSGIKLHNIQIPANASGLIAFLNTEKITNPKADGGVHCTASQLNTTQNSIYLSGLAENSINFVTLYAVYAVNGNTIYSDPTVITISTQPRKQITCTWNWVWKNTGSAFRKTMVITGAFLKIELPHDSEYCPEMRLIAKKALPPKSMTDGSVFMVLEEIDEELYGRIFKNNVRIIIFEAENVGDQINLHLQNNNKINLLQTTVSKGLQLKMFVSEIGFQIKAEGTWTIS